jgi:lipopolysaccharide/colanic/teichoic acid biosynthesis glycosyltransferase
MVRRITDILLSLLLILLSLPICIIISAAIKLDDGEKIFFTSIRTGLRGKRFNMYKFRTMCCNCNCLSEEQKAEFQANFKVIHDRRVTRIGRFLRGYSLDEIPQLLNVLKGDMSVIGPRPKLPEEIELYGNNKNELLSVLPGITGYWQVYRVNANSDETMRMMDLYYIRNRTAALDFKILLLSFMRLISKRNY